MKKQDQVYVQGQGYTDPNETKPDVDSKPPTPPPTKSTEERTLELLATISSDVRTSRQWIAFIGAVILIGLIISIIIGIVSAVEEFG